MNNSTTINGTLAAAAVIAIVGEGDDSDQISLCRGFQYLCTSKNFEYPVAFVNILGMFINVLQIVVITRMRSLRGVPYRDVLLAISFFDVLSGAAYIVKGNCELHKALVKSPKWVSMMQHIVVDSVTQFRYTLLMVACIERYIAVCRTFTYAQSLFTQNIKLLTTILFGCMVGIMTAREILSQDNMCVHPVVGALANSKVGMGLFLGVNLVPSFIATILLWVVFNEISAMKRRAIHIFDNVKQLRESAKYILIISVAFYCCYLPIVASFLVKTIFKINAEYTAMVVTLFNSLYGIFNSLVYGWRNYKFRVEMVTLFGCVENTVEPVQNLGTSSDQHPTGTSNGNNQEPANNDGNNDNANNDNDNNQKCDNDDSNNENNNENQERNNENNNANSQDNDDDDDDDSSQEDSDDDDDHDDTDDDTDDDTNDDTDDDTDDNNREHNNRERTSRARTGRASTRERTRRARTRERNNRERNNCERNNDMKME